ncbi:hypothetical protein C0995_011344 [Termitomyces sp. Mi166|nr:hypothetical protein C0995_011344 [Termitomyces sp. Mi166\
MGSDQTDDTHNFLDTTTEDMDPDPLGVEKKAEVHQYTPPGNANSTDVTLLAGTRLALVFGAFLISFALVALDQTILATALPKIASHFNAVSELSWIASGVLSIAPAKPILLFSIAVFEIGSLLCAVAPSVSVLILGRAVAGFGASGLWVSIMSTIGRVTTMAQRPILMGLFGALFAVASIVGPLIGGAFAGELCKLNWGGNTKPWSDPGVVVCLVLFSLLLLAFVAWEYKKGSDAILPLKMLLRRSVLGAFIASAFIQLAFVVAVYYLPLLYQVRGHSATKSGIDILPFMMYVYILLWPKKVIHIGFGLLFTTNLNSTTTCLLGYQILVGVGLGAAVQNTLVVAQAEYVNDEALVPRATSLITFTQCLGGSIGLAQLHVQLTNYAPELSQEAVIAVLSSVEAIFSLPSGQITSVKQAYTAAINRVMIAGVPFAVLASASAILIARKKLQQSSTGENL